MQNFFKNKYFITISTLLLLLSTSHTLSHSNINENKSNYIIKFFDNAKLDNEINDSKRRGIKVNHILDSIFKGYIGEMTKTQAQQLLKNPNIEFVELDAKITTFTQQINATWGLDRVDQSKLPLDSNYNYISDGKGVNVYVVDTGIFPHNDFANRILPGYSSIVDGRGTLDCNGHGTHVSGSINNSTKNIVLNINTTTPNRLLYLNPNSKDMIL